MCTNVSRGSRGTGVTFSAKGSITVGNAKIEFDGDLNYGKKDSTLSAAVRKEVETWENKRRKNKIEYAYSVKPDGTPIGPEIKGGRGSVRTPYEYHNTQDATFTHIHPRSDEGYLGGTFSLADLKNWATKPNKTERAAAKEGTYSISKGKNFDAKGFMAFARDADSEFVANSRATQRKLNTDYVNRKIGYQEYVQQSAKNFNNALIKLHETYRQGQNKYGYKYTLEQI